MELWIVEVPKGTKELNGVSLDDAISVRSDTISEDDALEITRDAVTNYYAEYGDE